VTDNGNDTGTIRWQIVVLAVAPAVLLAALVAHPYLAGRLPNGAAVADEVIAGTTRWGLVHLAHAVASALIAVAFLALRHYLHEAGEDRLSALGMPFVIVGSTLYAVLPGMEFAVLAAAETGGTAAEVAAAQDAIGQWFTPVLVVSGVTFGIGALSFASALRASGMASAGPTRVVAAALIVMAVSRIVPLSVAQLYVHGLAAGVAFWPVAYLMWTKPVTSTATPPARAG
jgi:hypothetical protein